MDVDVSFDKNVNIFCCRVSCLIKDDHGFIDYISGCSLFSNDNLWLLGFFYNNVTCMKDLPLVYLHNKELN